MHLSAIDLVDLAEGRRAPDSAPHLAACDRCRRQLDDLQTVIALAATADVPEPSTALLFGAGLTAFGWRLRRRG